MKTPVPVVLSFVITTGLAFSQQTLNPGTATDLQRLDIIGSNRIDQLMKSAASGNTEAQMRLGLAYQNGFDSVSGEQVGRDLAQAAKWFLAAAEHGNINGQYKIGYVLVNGDGVRRNYAEAAMW